MSWRISGSGVAWRWGMLIGQAAGDRLLAIVLSLPAAKAMSVISLEFLQIGAAEPILVWYEVAQLRLVSPVNSDLPY